MNGESEYEFFKLRKQAKTYISKVFSFNERNLERVRQVRMVIEGSDQVVGRVPSINDRVLNRMCTTGARHTATTSFQFPDRW